MKIFGMIIPDSTNQHFSNMANAFQKEFAQKGNALVVLDSNDNRSSELNNISICDSLTLHGIIFISVGDHEESYLALDQLNIPLLILDREIPMEKADFLISDDSKGITDGLRFLNSKGHKRIGFIKGNMNTEPGRTRYHSYLEWHNNRGITVNPHYVFDGDFQIGSGISAANQLLRINPENRPTAIFASNDLMAIGFQFELIRNGLKIPTNLSILGFDDILINNWIYPNLSSIRQDILEFAKQGVELLYSRINTPNRPNRVVLTTPYLIDRESINQI